MIVGFDKSRFDQSMLRYRRKAKTANSEPSRGAYNMAIMRGLTHFPEARAAVIAELDRIGQPVVDHPPPADGIDMTPIR